MISLVVILYLLLLHKPLLSVVYDYLRFFEVIYRSLGKLLVILLITNLLIYVA